MPAKVIRTSARFVKTAPDKIRILAGLVKGKNISKALDQLAFAGKYAATPLSMVLRQAKAQIKDQNLVENDFTVSEMRVDEGPKLKRRRIRHQGRSTAILKRMSHITIILKENDSQKSKVESRKEKPKLVKKEEV
jgi:large subunit ribosomal protein L22